MTVDPQGDDRPFKFYYARFLEQLSNIQESPNAIIGELVDNSVDAKATRVWVVLEPDSIVVADNGLGMNPRMRPADMEILRRFWDDIEQKRVDPEFDIRTLISDYSKRSLEWMAVCVAFSGKIPQPGQKIRGVRALGVQASRMVASQLEWRARPSRKISEGETPEVHSLVLPSLDDLRRYRIDSTIARVQEPLRAPTNKELDSGTVATLSKLRTGMSASLRPNALVEHLKTRFGADIKAGLELLVVDRISEDGRKSGGITITVPAPVYKGYPILQRVLSLRGGKASIEVDLWYDPEGKNQQVMLRRMGNNVRPISELREFQQGIFFSGKVSGHIEYVDLPEREAPWDTLKKTPLEGPIRNQWQHAIWNAVPDAEEKIKEIDARARNEKSIRAAKVVADATLEAMQELDQYKDLAMVPPKRKRPEPPKPPKPPKPEERVVVTVFDEHNHGVSGVTIELYTQGQLAATRETGTTGQITFGKLDFGRYTVRMIVPEGMTPADEIQEYKFNLGPNQLGIRAIFRLRTGRPKPEDMRIGRITVYTHPLSDPGQPYQESLSVGLVQINTEHEAYRDAYEADDAEILNTLMAEYVASAVTEYGLKGEPASVQLQSASALFAKALSHLRPRSRRRA